MKKAKEAKGKAKEAKGKTKVPDNPMRATFQADLEKAKKAAKSAKVRKEIIYPTFRIPIIGCRKPCVWLAR